MQQPELAREPARERGVAWRTSLFQMRAQQQLDGGKDFGDAARRMVHAASPLFRVWRVRLGGAT